MRRFLRFYTLFLQFVIVAYFGCTAVYVYGQSVVRTSLPNISNLMGYWPMVQCSGGTISGSTLPDCPASGPSGTYAGNLNNGTFTNNAGTGTPTASATGVSTTSNSTNKQLISFAAGAWAGAQTIAVCADVNSANFTSTGHVPIIGVTGGGKNAMFDLHPTDTAQAGSNGLNNYTGISTNNASNALSRAYETPVNNAVNCFIFSLPGSGQDAFYINGRVANQYMLGTTSFTNGTWGTAAAATTAVASLFGMTGAGCCSPSYYTGQIYLAAIWNTTCNQACATLFEQFATATLNGRGVQIGVPAAPVFTTGNIVICVGDSLTAGVNSQASGDNPCQIAANYLQPDTTFGTWTAANLGMGSATCSGLADNYVDGYLPNLDSSLAGKIVVTVWCGTNDMTAGQGTGSASPFQVVNYQRAIGRKLHAKGYKTVLIGMISRTSATTGAVNQQCSATTGVVAWGSGSSQCSGDAAANELSILDGQMWPEAYDAFVDLWQIGGSGGSSPNMFGAGANANPVAVCGVTFSANCYTGDGIHLRGPDGYQTLANVFITAGINRALGIPDYTGQAWPTQTGSYTMLDRQFSVTMNCASACTVTVPTAWASTGVRRYVNNIGAGTVTVQAAAVSAFTASTINGSASITANAPSGSVAGLTWIASDGYNYGSNKI